MFYAAEALLLGKDLAYSKHSAVIAAFGRHFVKSGRMDPQLHRFLREAQDQRSRGDYGTGDPLDDRDSAIQIERAEQFLAQAERELRSGEQV